jgi:hypothetical protein
MMMDNDFPMIAKETSNPRSPYDVYKAPDWAKPKYPQQPQEPEKEGPVKNAAGLGHLQEYIAGMTRYQQAGTDVPDFGMQTDYAQQAGGPLVGQTVAQGIPVGQDPIFPMSQEEFSDYVRGRLDQKNPPNRPIPANMMRRIQGVRAKYGFGSV